MLEAFREAMDLREEADYGARYSEEAAKTVAENAEKLLRRVEEILREQKFL